MTDVRRKAKLELLLERLRRGDNVQNRDLRTWLGEDGYADYEADCQQQHEFRQVLEEKPTAIREYEKRLKRALLAYNKGEGASSKGRKQAATAYYRAAETQFELLLEYLQEVIATDQSLRGWFDRDTDWTASSKIGLDPVSVPRVVTSRSLDNRGGGITRQLRNKRDLKIAAVERVLSVADGGKEDELTEREHKRLAAFLCQHEDD